MPYRALGQQPAWACQHVRGKCIKRQMLSFSKQKRERRNFCCKVYGLSGQCFFSLRSKACNSEDHVQIPALQEGHCKALTEVRLCIDMHHSGKEIG